ncbi:hypothetical protein ACJX0J_022718, partial [Zea mays]
NVIDHVLALSEGKFIHVSKKQRTKSSLHQITHIIGKKLSKVFTQHYDFLGTSACITNTKNVCALVILSLIVEYWGPPAI